VSRRRKNLRYLAILAVCIPLLYLLYVQRIRPFLIPSDSMAPALLPGDYVFAVKTTGPGGGPDRGDIVILYDPEDAEKRSYMAKRVVGMPGETVKITEGALYIDGKYVSEPYIAAAARPVYEYGPVRIPGDAYFVLGDNRNNSSDSSLWNQAVPKDDILGRVVFIYNPIRRMGFVG